MDTLGSKIRELRRARHLTQHELGNGKVSASLISQIESNKTFPTDTTMAHICDKLGVEPSYFAEFSQVNEQLQSYRHAKSLLDLGEFRKALEVYQDLLTGNSTDLKMLSVYTEAAECHYHLDELEEATRLYDAAVAAALELNDAATAVHTYYQLGNIQRKRNLPAYARMYWMRADAVLHTHRELNMPIAVKIHINLGRTNYLLGDYEAAKRNYSLAYYEARDLAAQLDVAIVAHGWANALMENGEYSAAAEMTETALTTYEALRHQRGINQCRLNLAAIMRRDGRSAEASELLTSYLRDPLFYRDPIRHAHALSERALCSLALGNPGEAWRDAQLFMYMADSDKEVWLSLQITAAEVYLHLGKHEEALAVLEAAKADMNVAPFAVQAKLQELYTQALANVQRLNDAIESAMLLS